MREKEIDIGEETIDSMSKDELARTLKKMLSGGVSLMFHGKKTAAEIRRKVKPRVMELDTNLSMGSEKEAAENMLIEGENLQAMVNLYKYRGLVDLIVTVIFSLLEYCIHSFSYRTYHLENIC